MKKLRLSNKIRSYLKGASTITLFPKPISRRDLNRDLDKLMEDVDKELEHFSKEADKGLAKKKK